MPSPYADRFKALCDLTVEGQVEFFLKRYIFALGAENVRKVGELANSFKDFARDRNTNELNFTEAAHFLQKNGKTRTAQERKMELRDIDLDGNGKIGFMEYLLLHFKVMILEDYFEKLGKMVPKHIDLSKDGVGVTGVGEYILHNLFTFGKEFDPEVEAAIELVVNERRARDERMSQLLEMRNDKNLTQVQRMKAQFEYLKLERNDFESEADRALLTLMAKRKKIKREAQKVSAEHEKALEEEKQVEEATKRKKRRKAKENLANKQNNYKDKTKVDASKFFGNARDRASIKMLMGRDAGTAVGMYTSALRK